MKTANITINKRDKKSEKHWAKIITILIVHTNDILIHSLRFKLLYGVKYDPLFLLLYITSVNSMYIHISIKLRVITKTYPSFRQIVLITSRYGRTYKL